MRQTKPVKKGHSCKAPASSKKAPKKRHDLAKSLQEKDVDQVGIFCPVNRACQFGVMQPVPDSILDCLI